MSVRCRPGGEHGFTLIELLVVIMIIGVLAAIALPTFLSQGQRGRDGAAKHQARSLLTLVEACETASADYTACNTKTELDADSFRFGAGAEEVDVTSATTNTFELVATSATHTAGVYHRFAISKSASGRIERTCTTGGASNSAGGCNGGTW